MNSNKSVRTVRSERSGDRGWLLELTIFVMLAPAMIYDFLSLGALPGA